MTRFSSCREVSFEINPHASPFSVFADRPSAPSFRLPWTLCSSGRVLPLQDDGPLLLGRSSSHFCDVYSDDEHDEDADMAIPEEDSDDVEKQQQGLPEPKELREVDKPVTTRKPTRASESRISTILLDQGPFTVYKRLFAVFFVVNMVLLGLAISGNFSYGRRKAAAFAIYNVLLLTLCRSELFLRFVFWFAVKALGRPRVPLWAKTATTSFLQCIGGIHSG